MFATKQSVRVSVATLASTLAFAAVAAAHEPAVGGATAPEPPSIEHVSCAGGEAACVRGQQLEVDGESLADTRAVVFLGRPGRRDDRRAAPVDRSAHELTVTVPSGARSGRLRVVTRASGSSRPSAPVRVRSAATPKAVQPVAAPGQYVFPIRGPHDLGQSDANNFGGARGHQGQDMFAACGTPVVAATAGTVDRATYQDRAGNYLVVTDAAGRSYVYMHLRKAALVSQGEQVQTGQAIGEVGDTGRASGCHLHFELWTAPGWYRGGEAIDPLPELRRWDASS